MTYDGTTWRIYLNGVLDTQLTIGAFTPRSDSIQHAALGTALQSAGVPSGQTHGFFQGSLDEARIWSVVRSAADIQAAMGESAARPGRRPARPVGARRDVGHGGRRFVRTRHQRHRHERAGPGRGLGLRAHRRFRRATTVCA